MCAGNKHFAADAISAIRLSELSADVRFEKSFDDNLHITYYESEKVFYDIETASDGTLSILHHSNRKWYDFIGFDFRDYTTVICVPDGFSGDISVKLSSGDLRITGFTLDGSLTAESTSGDVQMSDFTCTGDMKIQQTSGDFLSACIRDGIEFAKPSVMLDRIYRKRTGGFEPL